MFPETLPHHSHSLVDAGPVFFGSNWDLPWLAGWFETRSPQPEETHGTIDPNLAEELERCQIDITGAVDDRARCDASVDGGEIGKPQLQRQCARSEPRPMKTVGQSLRMGEQRGLDYFGAFEIPLVGLLDRDRLGLDVGGHWPMVDAPGQIE